MVGYLTEAIDAFAGRTDVVFASHHWPTWGHDRSWNSFHSNVICTRTSTIRRCVSSIRVSPESRSPNRFRCPRPERAWHTHGYYGNGQPQRQAVYQRYTGWFDGNPAGCGRIRPRLWHLATSTRWRQIVSSNRRDAFDVGDFRWAANPSITSYQREAPASPGTYDTLEQLAYGAECATWRNFLAAPPNCGRATLNAAQTARTSMLAQPDPGRCSIPRHNINVRGRDLSTLR